MIEIDEIAMSESMIKGVRARDTAAIAAARAMLDGVVLYCHALHAPDLPVSVSLRELEELGVIESVQIQTRV